MSVSDTRAVAGSLSFDGIGMIFPDGTEAVRDITLTINKGEFVTIVGPSGCGKSTLLKIASGLLEPTAGEVAVDRETVGYVFQDPTLLPWRTVRRNVELLTEQHGYPKDERRRLTQEKIELVGLKGFEDHYPKSLSGGMRIEGVTRPNAHPESAGLPLRRALRSRRRDDSREPQ